MISRNRQRGFWNFVIPAVAAVAGSVLNKKSADKAAAAQERAYDQQSQAQLEMNEANLAAQKEFAQHGIRWKVEDAKQAGLHPLFGAGLTGASFSPSFQAVPSARPTRAPTDYSWLANIGQLLGNFLNQPEARPAQQQAAQAAQGPSQSVTITEHPGGGRTIVYPIQGLESQVQGHGIPEWTDVSGRLLTNQAADPYPHVTGSAFKADPFWQQFQFDGGMKVILPKTSEPQEVFEDKPLWFWAMVAKANVRMYGPGWLTQARQQFPSLREVWNGVVQELETSGILPSVRGAVPDFLKR